MAHEQEQDEVPRIDIRSRIAAFSNGNHEDNKAPTERPNLLRPSENHLRKTPSLAELRAAQASGEDKQRSESRPAKLDVGFHANRPRSVSNLSNRSGSGGLSDAGSGRESPRLGVKGILALYGQGGQQQATISAPLSTMSTPKGPPAAIPPRPSASTRHMLDPSEDADAGPASLQLVESLSPSPSSTVSRNSPISFPNTAPSLPQRPNAQLFNSAANVGPKPPPPIPPARPSAASSSTIASVPSLPPRRLNGLVTKTDTGSSTSSSSSGSVSVPAYAPYQRRNGGGDASSSSSYSTSPALPPRSGWAGRSNDDLHVRDGLSVDKNKQASDGLSNQGLSGRARGMSNLGTKWASASSGELREHGALNNATALPSSAGTLPPPPPQRTHKAQSSSLNSVSSLKGSNFGDDPVRAGTQGNVGAKGGQDDSNEALGRSLSPTLPTKLPPPRRLTNQPPLIASASTSTAPVAAKYSMSSSRASASSPNVIPRSASGPIADSSASRASQQQQQSSSRSSSPTMVPPPRHIESTRRLAAPAQFHSVGGVQATSRGLGSASDVRPRASSYLASSSSVTAHRSYQEGRSRGNSYRPRRKEASNTRLSRDPGSARQRYESLFTSLLSATSRGKGKEERAVETISAKRTAMVWRRSRLPEKFLAKVWERAVRPEQLLRQKAGVQQQMGDEKGTQPVADADPGLRRGGKRIEREAFIRAMAAIDHELARRRARYLARKAT